MNDKFHTVWCEGGGTPTYKHANEDAAVTEALRLATLHGGRFYVMKPIGVCEPTVAFRALVPRPDAVIPTVEASSVQSQAETVCDVPPSVVTRCNLPFLNQIQIGRNAFIASAIDVIAREHRPILDQSELIVLTYPDGDICLVPEGFLTASPDVRDYRQEWPSFKAANYHRHVEEGGRQAWSHFASMACDPDPFADA